jgi:hypothetical protein
LRCVAVFPRTGATNRAFLRSLLSHCAVSIRVQACVVCSANFTGIKNGRFSLATCLCEILFRIRENVFGDFRNVKTTRGDVKKWRRVLRKAQSPMAPKSVRK